MPLNNLSAVVLVKNDQYWLRYALESTRELFKNYVFYDIASEDRTRDVMESFIKTLSDDVEVMTRYLPMCPPSVQGCFRNSMIAEARSDWYFILDGDEVYSQESIKTIAEGYDELTRQHCKDPRKIYGVLTRTEVGTDLQTKYNETRTHHRLYHRSAIWTGNHPGEVPFYEQLPKREFVFPESAMCYHMHNAARSPHDPDALKRIERRSRPTYRPGTLVSFDILGALPILKKKFDDIPVNPTLERLQNDSM